MKPTYTEQLQIKTCKFEQSNNNIPFIYSHSDNAVKHTCILLFLRL